jgi:phenylalanyl-tRNA synthetase beta chain
MLHGPGIVVRRATEGERLVTLDGVERTFTSDDLLIADVDRAVAVAGVMGGAIAEMSDSTTDVLLESATFERGGIQRTRRRIDLSTEASMRFERGVDPEATPVGADRAAQLMTSWCGARVSRGAIEVGGAPSRRRIPMRVPRATALLGYPVSTPDAVEVFERLAMPVEPVGADAVEVEIPGYRVDVEREVDLIEEVARIQGYDRVGSTLPSVRQAGGVPDDYAFVQRVRGALVRAGLREVRLIPFSSADDLAIAGGDDAVRVTNPLAAEEGWLRTSLLPGLIATLRRNLARHVAAADLFEVGRVFRMGETSPEERLSAGFAMTGPASRTWTEPERPVDAFDAKGVLEAVLADLGVDRWTIGEPHGAPLHPGRSAKVLVDGWAAGVVGELHPSLARRLDLPSRVAVCELDVAALLDAASTRLVVRDVPRFPPVRRDLAFTVDDRVPAGTVRAAIEDAAGDLLGSCVLFDVHVGPPLPAGKRSLAFALDLQPLDRSLTGDEADRVVARIAETVGREVGGELRTA